MFLFNMQYQDKRRTLALRLYNYMCTLLPYFQSSLASFVCILILGQVVTWMFKCMSIDMEIIVLFLRWYVASIQTSQIQNIFEGFISKMTSDKWQFYSKVLCSHVFNTVCMPTVLVYN